METASPQSKHGKKGKTPDGKNHKLFSKTVVVSRAEPQNQFTTPPKSKGLCSTPS
jgi:hypothetical protein